MSDVGDSGKRKTEWRLQRKGQDGLVKAMEGLADQREVLLGFHFL